MQRSTNIILKKKKVAVITLHQTHNNLFSAVSTSSISQNIIFKNIKQKHKKFKRRKSIIAKHSANDCN